jgi:citrate lyase beta subunit|tara:strand:+ start:2598 stop:3572 length:975 start_codon:yes stop_codon:yes gene_type:complete
MNDINLIQYLPLSHPRATMRFVKKLSAAGVMCILDLEDSVQDPFNKNLTKELKTNARDSFLKFVRSKAWSGNEFQRPIYVRVNSMNTEFFEDDIKMILKIVSAGFPVSGIFLPMVESYTQITETHALLEACKNNFNNQDYLDIVPMIETTAGMSALEHLLESDKNNQKFSKVHYGHFDYCLDAKLWPFPDPDHHSFWALAESIASLILRHKKTYIHTPFPFTSNQSLFWAASRHLLQLFPNQDIWVCTLNSELSMSTESMGGTPLKPYTPDSSIEFKLKEAQLIHGNYLAGRANRRSFGVSGNRFIPPHQYFAADQYLKKHQLD